MKELMWQPLTPYAIHLEGKGWFSGRVMDMLIYGDSIIIATAFGGIWAINTNKPETEGYVTTCLTDGWDDPNVNSLMFGPDNNSQLYAGCEKKLYYATLSNGTNGTLMTFSTPINLPVADANTIYRIVVQKQARRIIIATGAGLWWSPIPPDPKIVTGYVWKKATGLSGDKIPGLCKAENDGLHASVWGDDTILTDVFGIFKGVFQNNDLHFTKSKLNWKDNLSEKDMTRVSLASCANNPAEAFAVCAKHFTDNPDGGKRQENFRGVLRYDAAKDQWNDILNAGHFKTSTDPFPGSQGSFNNCIAVAPDNSELAAFGWQKGTYVFANGSWKRLNDVTTHHDMHGLLFTGVTNGFHNLYVGGDGGILKVTAPTHDNPKFDDHLNMFLPTLLFKDDLRRAYATIDVSSEIDGLIAGGLQDNGVKYLKTVKDKYSRWQFIIGADGGTNTFLANGILISRESNAGNMFKSFTWNHQQNIFNAGLAIPLPAGVDILDEPRMEICARIPLPVYRNKNNRLLHAVSAAAKKSDSSNIVLGLFDNSDSASDFQWEIIGNAGAVVTAAASVDGRYVFVATNDGKLNFLNVAKFINKEAGANTDMTLPDVLKNGNIVQFEIVSAQIIFALYVTKTQGYIIVYNGLVWTQIPTPVNETIYSIAADWTAQNTVLDKNDKKLFFSTDTAVYQGVQDTNSHIGVIQGGVTTTPGNVTNSLFPHFNTAFIWEKTTASLPARCHFNHLRTGWDDKTFYLYVSSYGRSVYRAAIRAIVTLPRAKANTANIANRQTILTKIT